MTTHNVRIETQALIDLKKLIAFYTEQDNKSLSQQEALSRALKIALKSLEV